MASAALTVPGDLCCAHSEQDRNLSLVLSCGCLGPWQLWRLCRVMLRDGWVLLGPYRHRLSCFLFPERGDQGLAEGAAFRGSWCCCSQVRH